MPPAVPARARLERSLPVLGAFAVGAIAYGGLYCFPPISVALAADFGVNRTLAVLPWTVFLLVSGLSSPLLGRAYDIFFDRQLLTAGLLLLAGGWVVVSVAPDVSTLVIGYGLLLAVGLELVFVGTTTAIARRYAGVAGLALGLAYAGPGIGVAVALPIVTQLMAAAGWRSVTAGFAGLSLLGLPFVWLMTSGPAILVPARERASRQPAAEAPHAAHRELPETLHDAREAHEALHETSAPGAVAAAWEPLPPGSQPRAAGLRRTLRTRRFWILFTGALAIGTVDEGLFQTFLPNATGRGIPEGIAATGLGLESLAYVVGQVTGGALSDRFGRRFVGLGVALLMALGASAAFLAGGTTPWLALGGIVVHGFGIGATIAVRSAAFSDVFGGHSFGAIFGVLAVAYPLGGIVAVQAGALSVDRLGTYLPVLGLILGAIALWAVALAVAGPRRHGLRARLARLPGRRPA